LSHTIILAEDANILNTPNGHVSLW